jgi:flavorubredoxin
MESVVIYASRKGNTRHIAETIAASLARHGTVRTWCVDETPEVVPAGTDLLVIGGPTETHGMTPRLAGYLDQLELAEPGRLSAAAFDTRLRLPRILSGSAAVSIAKSFRARGVELIVPEESFFVTKEPDLEPGELERAAVWAESLSDAVTSRMPELAGATR